MNTKSLNLSKLISSKQLITKHFVIIFLFLSMGFAQLNSQVLNVFTDIPGRVAEQETRDTEKYVCQVRQVGEPTWEKPFVIQTKSLRNPSEYVQTALDNGFHKSLENWTASYIAFEFSNTTVEVEIAKKDGSPITKAVVRPAGYANVSISDGKAYVTFTKTANVNVDINGQMEDQYTGQGYAGPPIHTISIFANPVYTPPTAGKVVKLKPGQSIRNLNSADWDAVIFEPGIHDIGTQYEIQSNKTLYIPGDAIVHGTIHPNKTTPPKGWTVYGSGAISGEKLIWNRSFEIKNKVFTNKSSGIRCEGFVVIDPTNHTFNMDNQGTDLNIYKNLKILGWRKNGDGVNAFRNSVVSDCFFRVQDDAFYLGRNVKIHNNTTWNDANGSVMYLTLSDVNSHFKDIKVIYQRAKWHYWSAGRVMCMRNTDGPIENVICQNILIEDPYPSFAPFFATMSSGTYNFSNIVFDNIHQAAKCVGVYDPAQKDNPQNTFFGTSKSIIKNITFRNCFYNGKYLTKFEDDPDWLLNEFVDKSTIKFEVNQVGPPVANFTGAPTKFNQGAVVSFADRSSNGPNTFAWSFPGGTPSTSTEQNPMVTYYTDGKFSVKLVVTNPLGSDTKEMTSYITVYKTPTYILTLNAINGSITKSPDTGTYAAGTDVTLTPVAAHGYEFLNWSGDATGTTNPLVVNMSSNKNITANFISLTNVNKVFDVAYNIYPNPVSEYIYIDLKNVNFRNEIKLINNCGQVVYKTSTNNGKVQIDTKSLNLKGIYLVQVIAGEKVSTQKIIVK